ncbi:hypothetical protein NEOLEDRAFT_1074911, partial [Neolentinus lepideus HHB14362 ss-1]
LMSSQAEDSFSSFFSVILKPGSSLHPNFLLALDVVFAALLLVLLTLAFLTQGNIHLIALTCIELCLWASVKWCARHKWLVCSCLDSTVHARFVAELKKTQPTIGATQELSNTERLPELPKEK